MPRSHHYSKSSAPTVYKGPSPSPPPIAYTPPKQSVGSILKESFAFGVGQASGFHVVNALLSPFSKSKTVEQKEAAPPSKPCSQELTLFEQCLLLDNYSGHNCFQEQKNLSNCINGTR